MRDIMGGERFSTSAPTTTHKQGYEIAAQEFAGELAKLHSLSDQLQTLEKQLEAAGAPWTPGRIPDWKPE